MWTSMRPERGFTLLETLLALAIGGLVLTAAYTAVVRAVAARDGATRRTADVARGRQAILEVARAVESATPHPFGAGAGGLLVAHADPEPRLLTYALEGTKLTERLSLPFATDHAEPGAARVLFAGARAFSVRCFDGSAWTEDWRSENAPRAVELALRLADGEELRTRVVLPLGAKAAGGGGGTPEKGRGSRGG